MMGVVCRLSEEAAPELACIEEESNRPPWPEELFRSEFLQSHSLVLGIRTSGQLAGFVVCHVVFDEAHVMNFAVRAMYRRRGLGRALLVHLFEELFSQGVRRVTLEVRRGNAPAKGLYESLGFQEVAVRPKYYSDNGEDALVMGLDLLHFIQNCARKRKP